MIRKKLHIIVVSCILFIEFINSIHSNEIEVQHVKIETPFVWQIHQEDFQETPSLAICLHLTDKTSMISESLHWHYKMGIRHFQIVVENLEEKLGSLIRDFEMHVEHNCSIHICQSFHRGMLPKKVSHILNLKDKQFLCASQRLQDFFPLLDDRKYQLPVYLYQGTETCDEERGNRFVDELATYRSSTPDDFVLLQRADLATQEVDNLNLESINGIFIAQYGDLSDLTLNIGMMIYQPLYLKKHVLQTMNAIYHAFSAIQRDEYNFLRRYYEYEQKYGTGEILYKQDYYLWGSVLKCGSSSLSKFFQEFDLGRDYGVHYSAARYQLDHNCITSLPKVALSSKVFKFSVVRNPFIRILSAFLDKLVKHKSLIPEYMRKLDLRGEETTFLEFLKAVQKKPIKYLDPHFRPQFALIFSEIIRYDFIGKLETFDEDFAYIMKRLGVNDVPQNYNRSGHATHASQQLLEYYTPESIRLVKEIYRKDFELYGYSKELPVGDILPEGSRLFNIE